MRALLCCAVLAACGPKVMPAATAFDEDLETNTAGRTPAAPPAEQARPEAPRGKGLRTGTIERAKLIAVLDHGPGAFLRQLEVAPHMDGNRFVGWELVQLLDRNGPLVDVDVAPGDVLLAINGKRLSRPDQLQALWDSLRTANELRAQLWRGDTRLELAFAIEPRVDVSGTQAPPAPRAPAAKAPAARAPAEQDPAARAPAEQAPAARAPADKAPAARAPAEKDLAARPPADGAVKAPVKLTK